MARASGQKDYVSLNKGLITEASPLAFPEGATSSEVNFTINKNGLIRERRKGFQRVYDQSSVYPGDNSVLENMFYWRGSGYVIAIITNDTPETYLRIHAMNETFVDIANIKIADARVSTQIAELTNYLVVTLSNEDKPILLAYNEDEATIDVSTITLHVRDFELVDDDLAASTNPSTLTDNHKYNLYNAGWYVSKKDETTAGNPRDNVVDIYYSAFSSYPSNADSVALGMITNADGEYTFDPEYVRDAGLGNSLAPRGHYIYPVDDFDRDSKVTTLGKNVDGSPSTTLSILGVVNLTGTPTYNPDDPDNPDNPDVPWNPYPPIDNPPPGTERP